MPLLEKKSDAFVSLCQDMYLIHFALLKHNTLRKPNAKEADRYNNFVSKISNVFPLVLSPDEL